MYKEKYRGEEVCCKCQSLRSLDFTLYILYFFILLFLWYVYMAYVYYCVKFNYCPIIVIEGMTKNKERRPFHIAYDELLIKISLSSLREKHQDQIPSRFFEDCHEPLSIAFLVVSDLSTSPFQDISLLFWLSPVTTCMCVCVCGGGGGYIKDYSQVYIKNHFNPLNMASVQ